MKLEKAVEITQDLFNKDLKEANIFGITMKSLKIPPRTIVIEIAGFPCGNKKNIRVIPPYGGYYVNINRAWFQNNNGKPIINDIPFDYYLMLKEHNRQYYYHLCHYLKMREYVLNYKGNRKPFENQDRWNGKIVVRNNQFQFKWNQESDTERILNMNNLAEIVTRDFLYSDKPLQQPVEAPLNYDVHKYGSGGESDAHKNLNF